MVTRAGRWLVVAVALMAGCARQPAEPAAPPAAASRPPAAEPATDKVQVIATIFPLADLTAKLAGSAAEVATLVPAGATSHTYALTTQQATQLAHAKLIVRVGPGYDDWLASALEGSQARVVECMAQTELLEGTCDDHEHQGEHQHAADPHLWLDPIRLRDDVLPAVAEQLIQAMPFEMAGISSRLKSAQDELTALDAEIREALAPITNRRYIAAHAGWGYWNQRYDLEQVASIELVPGTEPSGRWRLDILRRAGELKVKAIFAEAQLSQAAAEALAKDGGLTARTLDMYGGPEIEGRDSYAAMMRYNAAMFAEGLADG